MEDDKRPHRVPLVGYDGISARLDNVFDALNNLQETMVILQTRKRAVTPKRATRPETAQQRLKRQQSMRKLDSIVDKMTGGR